MSDLRDYQVNAIERTRQSLRAGKKHPLVMAATGAGKTKLAGAVIRLAGERGRRVCFTVPSITLIDQTVEAFGVEGLGDQICVIQADHPLTNWAKPIQVASVQTLARRDLPATDMVIVDEAHEAHRIIFRWMQERPDLPFVGLSATPWTRGLGRYYDDLIIAATTKDLIARGFLSPFKVYAPSHPDLKGVHTVAGDYHEGELATAMDKPELTADVVATWLRLGENRPTLCFAVNRAHAHSLADQFEAAGVPTAYVDAYTEREDRRKVGEALRAGRVKVVVNIGVLTRGVDWDVRCIILSRPTKSEIQIIGRALRTAPGKADALILDHSDTTLNLGFVDDIHHEQLDSRKPGEHAPAKQRERKAPVPRECSSCHYLKPAGTHVCPSCGFAPAKREDIATADGDLALVRGDKLQADRETKQRFWSGPLWIARERGYAEGWASHKYKAKFGVWPRGLSDTPRQPDVTTRNWVKASAIAWEETGQAWAAGSVGPDVVHIDGANIKATVEDAERAPGKGFGDAATGGGIGAGGIGGVLQTAQEQLTPYSSASGWIETLVVILIVVGVVLAAGGFAYRLWAKRRTEELEDALDAEGVR